MKSGFIFINESVFPTLLALSEKEQERGLMFQPWKPPNMCFLYKAPRICKFWMKNTPSPLDIIFCCDGIINNICKGEPHSTTSIGKDEPSDLVIELPYGTAKEHSIGIGSKVGFIIPDKKELKKIMSIL